MLQYFIVKIVPARFHVFLSALHLYICVDWKKKKICTVFYNKQFYVQQAGVVASEKGDVH